MDMEFAKQLIDQYGYLAVFLSTVIEGEVVVLAAAALAALGMLEAHWVIAVSAAGAFVGHLLLFAVGRWKGMLIIEAFPLLRRHYPKANKIMDDYANWSVFIFQYLYGMRIVSAILFGCSTISASRFFFLQSINCIIWAFVVYFAGHMIGVVAMQLFEMVGIYGLLVVIAVVGLVVLKLYHRYGHHHVMAFLASGRKVGAEQLDECEGRHFVLEQLDYHMGLAKRSEQPLTLLLIKLATKDEKNNRLTLKFITKELNMLLQEGDIPARFSHDTYAIISPCSTEASAKQSVHDLMMQMEKDLPKHAHLAPMCIGYSEWHFKMTSGQLLDEAYGSMKPLTS
ncbi:VTT domain-containing protein [Mariprofundus sp. EBB-1]|uniref:VTT domain-containing protein n=1 Tax=Mariprofundus sp. EBB-1 TaxID=2650971 RepID=UPI001F19544F|nr:VTT domain-containing protein [Mariprofundus sp. EBB-1]